MSVAGIDPGIIRDKASAVIFVIDGMDDTGNRNEYLFYVPFLIGFFQFLSKTEIVSLCQEILFSTDTVPCVRVTDRVLFTIDISLILGQVIGIRDILVICKSTVLVVYEIEIT